MKHEDTGRSRYECLMLRECNPSAIQSSRSSTVYAAFGGTASSTLAPSGATPTPSSSPPARRRAGPCESGPGARNPPAPRGRSFLKGLSGPSGPPGGWGPPDGEPRCALRAEGGPRQSRLVAFFSIVLGSSGAGEKGGESVDLRVGSPNIRGLTVGCGAQACPPRSFAVASQEMRGALTCPPRGPPSTLAGDPRGTGQRHKRAAGRRQKVAGAIL